MVKEHFDNSKLGDFLICPRMYYFNWELKIEPDDTSPHLGYGTCIHTGLAHLYEELKTGRTLNPDVVKGVQDAFRNQYEELDLQPVGNKTLTSGLLALDMFMSNSGYWDFGKVLLVEEEIRTADGYAGRLDLVTEIDDTIYVIDHKTTSRLASDTFSRWRQDRALLGYNYLVRQAFPGRKQYVTIVNVFHIVKKLGIFTNRYEFNDFHVDEWKWNTKLIIDTVRSHKAFNNWPKYDTGCQDSKWGCNYQDLCDQAVPLQDLIIPAGFVEKEAWYV